MTPELKKALHQAIADYKELTLYDKVLRAKMEAAGANMLVYEKRIAPIFHEGESELLGFILSTLENEVGITKEAEDGRKPQNQYN